MEDSKPVGPPPPVGSFSRDILQLYNYYLKKYPLQTKCISSALTSTLADFIAQISHRQKTYEFKRTLAFALFGFFATGPIMHNFYKLIGDIIKPTQKYSQAVRLIVERLIFAPAFLLLFFYSIPTLQGKGIKAAHTSVRAAYWSALKANWRVWTVFQYINLSYVPQQHQTLFANILALFWNIYLSSKQSS